MSLLEINLLQESNLRFKRSLSVEHLNCKTFKLPSIKLL